MKNSLRFPLFVVLISCAFTPLSAQQPSDTLSKLVLMKLSRDQSLVLCKSDVFTRCMGFEQSRCLQLAEEAVERCLGPLSDPIILSELQNETLEACPQSVYSEAGYTEKQAQVCMKKALE